MHCEVAVIGLGAVGSYIVKELAQDGVDVIGFERQSGVHANAAYAGESRLFRTAYHEGSEYVDALLFSRQEWSKLNFASSSQIFLKTGVLSVGAEDAPEMAGVLESLEAHGLAHTAFDSVELKDWFPQHKDTSGDIGILDELGGVLLSERAVQVLQFQALGSGASLLQGVDVRGVIERPGRIVIETSLGQYTTEQLIICAGVWTPVIVPELHDLLEIRPIPLLWYLINSQHQFEAQRHPGFIRDKEGAHIYGFPTLDGATVKVGVQLHPDPIGSPNDLPSQVSRDIIQRSSGVIQDLLHGLAPEPVRASMHMDVFTTNKRPVIDKVSERTTVATGFSGHGFKLTPAWGRLAIDLAMNRAPFISPRPYRLDRD